MGVRKGEDMVIRCATCEKLGLDSWLGTKPPRYDSSITWSYCRDHKMEALQNIMDEAIERLGIGRRRSCEIKIN